MSNGYVSMIAFFPRRESAESFQTRLKSLYAGDVRKIDSGIVQENTQTATQPVSVGDIIVKIEVRENRATEIQILVSDCGGRNALPGQEATFEL
ncbi:hypothetical protein QUB36_27880 [Microcoleus sp. AT8-B1]|uniref:hypothetical protein n=1 Tax=unclassified Microcoleus TaxID=2642155 RepID=UPI002FD51F9D